MSNVQVRHNLRANPDGKFDDRLATVVGERLIALEKAMRGAVPGFTSPALPAFGSGTPGGLPGAPGAPGTPGAPGAPGTPGAPGSTTIVESSLARHFLLMGA